eukprot:Plantae.Rhodophyta-Purpureofilum_apyrenoidigerum.ctg37783.p1 GENE.Plantae.Rhodophyta-Purpureofilum_apyrenoidigerum.ctg37783~~Plantae.Rhodophyta-Purpureofilum_apyrenoidigerum.ctg37783.p1  ORF type:complete len:372 (+),score=61.95 Plantae.Rhodophyta-Purpureofilum_apyrenoidigerum.ctg37783:146-1261(+)
MLKALRLPVRSISRSKVLHWGRCGQLESRRWMAETRVGELTPDERQEGLDPFQLIGDELKDLATRMQETVRILDVPSLNKAALHFFERGGKSFRPVALLLLAGAAGKGEVLPSQRRLAEITEMIHTASLLHDDVIDVSDTRRGVETVNQMLGSHMAVLAGDFVLARASAALAKLNDCDVIQVLAQVIDNLVRGEVLQLNVASIQATRWEDYFDAYLEKTYYKTASLLANSCRAILMLENHSSEACDAAFSFGKNLGLCFQVVDDALDMCASEKELGKPACADMRSGNATAPALYALKQYPEIEPVIRRRFKGRGDVEFVFGKIQECNGIEQTYSLADMYASYAQESLKLFAPSEERNALEKLIQFVLQRRR